MVVGKNLGEYFFQIFCVPSQNFCVLSQRDLHSLAKIFAFPRETLRSLAKIFAFSEITI